MDWDERFEIERKVKHTTWLAVYMRKREEELTTWVSTFHPDRLQCSLVHQRVQDDARGSFNVGCTVRFTNGETWMVRFPRGGKVVLADEKVVAEVATIHVVRNRTTIPVPEIKAWGRAADNKLGIGPFIMTIYVEGVSLGQMLQDSAGHLMRPDVSDEMIKTLFRQVARIVLQLSKLDFARIGSISTESESPVLDDNSMYAASVQSRPLTLKAHDILQVGGVNALCPPTTTFSSASDYFTYLADQDLQHLRAQPNSVDDEQDARNKYIYWNVMKALVSRFVSPETDHGPFKMICDDFGPANMIVNNAEDLQIVLVHDWEWSYAGPEELFWSPPRWLVFEAPNAWSGEMEGNLTRYNKYFEIYLEMVEEQEEAIVGKHISQGKRPSSLLRRRHQDGSMWFYLILRDTFNGPTFVPFQKLRAAVTDFDELAQMIPEDDIQQFVQSKTRDLEGYNSLLAATKEWEARIIAGEEEVPAIEY